MEYQLRDGKLRFEMAEGRDGKAAMIIDPANQKMLMLMPAQKMYMERTFSGADDAAQAASGRAKITATGKKETVAGYACEHFLITDEDGKNIDACIAHGLGSFLRMGGNPMSGAPAAKDWSAKIGKDGFPLKATKDGSTIMEVTKIEKMSLDPSLFSAPSGWKKFEMPSIPGMGRPR